MHQRVAALAVVAAIVSTPAHAARPYFTDDARITPAGGCQIESWVQRNTRAGGGTEFWALPACTPGENLEITAGVNRLPSAAGLDATGNFLIQGKTLLRELDTGIGTGFAFGAQTRVRGGSGAASPSSLAEFYGYNVTSFSFADEAFVLLTLAGAGRDREASRTVALWGIGTETRLLRRGDQELILAAEYYGSAQGSPSWQAGFRFWVVKEKVQIDAVVGRQIGSAAPDSRWWSVGLRLIGDGLLR